MKKRKQKFVEYSLTWRKEKNIKCIISTKEPLRQNKYQYNRTSQFQR